MKCPICGSKKNIQISFLPKFLYCLNCKGHFLKKNKRIIYKTNYFLEKNRDNFISKIVSPLLKYFYNLRLKKIEPFIKNKKIKVLDYGCGKGDFVGLIKNKGINSLGYEPSKYAINLAKTKKIPVKNRLNAIKHKFGVITMWHSLEHSDTPLKDLRTIKKYMKSNSHLIIAVPNADSWEAKIGKEKWFHYSYPLHRVAFTPYSIRKMLKLADFKTEEIDFFNPEYTISGLIQTFLNLFFSKDILYSVVSQRRSIFSSKKTLYLGLLSIVILFLFSVN